MMFSLRSVLLFLFSSSSVLATTLISESDARLPMAVSSVITDLEAEGVEHVTTACLLTSRGVTPSKRAFLLKKLFGVENVTPFLTAFGTTPEEDDVDGLAIAQPLPDASATEVATTVVACGGTVVYVPSPIDLARGEGLFDGLGPAMERLLNQEDNDESKSCLVVVVPEGTTTQEAKSQLETSAAKIIPCLVQPSNKRAAAVLEDVFDSVQYVSPQEGTLEDFLTEQLECSCEPSQALSSVASTVDVLSLVTSAATNALSTSSIHSPQDLCAARQLGPAARAIMDRALASVQEAIVASPGGLVMSYGDLCDAIVTQAMKDLGSVKGSSVSKQIRTNLETELYAELGEIFDSQLKVLQLASFEEFRATLSQLKVSPLLSQEMTEKVKASIASFSKAAKGMMSKHAKPSWNVAPAKTQYSRMLNEYSAERLLAAQASGAFRPIPRKGVTVGMHWLLPKPFGNDFRQEPWTMHAMDNLVYVPPDKVTNVSPDSVKSGNWRDKIVPSPASRDMVFMQ